MTSRAYWLMYVLESTVFRLLGALVDFDPVDRVFVVRLVVAGRRDDDDEEKSGPVELQEDMKKSRPAKSQIDKAERRENVCCIGMGEVSGFRLQVSSALLINQVVIEQRT